MKKNVKASACLAPVPAVMVTCGGEEDANIITLAWVGTVNSEPPVLSISVRYSRHSHALIEKYGEFTVNLVSEELVRQADTCGVVSGRNADKFALCKLTKAKGEKVSCPYVGESPAALECKVIKRVDLPTHSVFFGEVVNVIADGKYVDGAGRLALPAGLLVAYENGKYLRTGEQVGSYGFSAKNKTL